VNAFYEQRQVQIARFVAADFVSKLNLSDAQLQDYYKAHSERFQSAEQVDVSYVVLDLAAVQKGIVVPEAELKTYYEQNLSRLSALEERRASHILIGADKSAPTAERDKARNKAQELLAAIQQSPDKFADLARKNSQDPGSAAKGGDLDFFARGAMVKPFEDAAFSLKKGETSGVVETEFGFHIIRVTDIKQPKTKSFEEQRASLEVDVRRQLAQRKFAEAAEQFTNLVYEQSDSLKPAAERLKLEILSANNLGREPAASGVMANPKLLAAIFSADSLEKKRNTEAIEIGPNQLVSARVTRYTPARTLPFDEVKARVQQQLQSEKSAELARQEGADKLSQWKTHPETAKLGSAIVLSREQTQQQPSALVEAALRAGTQQLPAWVGVDLGASGYAVVKVEKIVPRDDATSQNRARERAQYAQWWASAEGLAYYGLLKEKFKVEIKAPRL
jgi:peptidyl-prolyl cis-trans isomerase D